MKWLLQKPDSGADNKRDVVDQLPVGDIRGQKVEVTVKVKAKVKVSVKIGIKASVKIKVKVDVEVDVEVEVEVEVEGKVGDIRLPVDRLIIIVNEATLKSGQSGVLGSSYSLRLAIPAKQTAPGVARRRRRLPSNADSCPVDTRCGGGRAGDAVGGLCTARRALSLPVSQVVNLHSPRLGRQGIDFSGARRVD